MYDFSFVVGNNNLFSWSAPSRKIYRLISLTFFQDLVKLTGGQELPKTYIKPKLCAPFKNPLILVNFKIRATIKLFGDFSILR